MNTSPVPSEAEAQTLLDFSRDLDIKLLDAVVNTVFMPPSQRQVCARSPFNGMRAQPDCYLLATWNDRSEKLSEATVSHTTAARVLQCGAYGAQGAPGGLDSRGCRARVLLIATDKGVCIYCVRHARKCNRCMTDAGIWMLRPFS